MSGAEDADPVLLKTILEHLERHHLKRKDVSGLGQLFFKSSQYGERYFPKSKQNALRNKWDNIRRLKAEGYKALLAEFNVPPGRGTTQELEEARAAKSAFNNVEYSSSTSHEDFDEEASAAFETLRVSEPSPALAARFQSTPPPLSRTSTPNHHHSFPSPPASAATNDMYRPYLSPMLAHPSPVASSVMAPTVIQGTEANPYKYTVNRLYPERNPSPISFCFIARLEAHNATYPGVEFALEVPIYDVSKVQATLKSHCIIGVKVPTIPHYQKAEVLWDPACHDATALFPADEATEQARRQQEIAIEGDPVRAFKHYEFEIPGVVLDNSIMSGFEIGNVIRHQVRKVKATPAPNDAGYKSLVLTWKVAEARGSKFQQQAAPSVDDLLNM